MRWIVAGGVALVILAWGWSLLAISGRVPPAPDDALEPESDESDGRDSKDR